MRHAEIGSPETRNLIVDLRVFSNRVLWSKNITSVSILNGVQTTLG